MEELAYLGDQPHLPLSESTSLAEAIALCNQFYQTNLNPEDYLQTQAYMTPTGKLQIDVIPVKDGVQSDVVITFVNKAFSFVNELKIDQSISHNGVCLTVIKIKDNTYTVTAMKETL